MRNFHKNCTSPPIHVRESAAAIARGVLMSQPEVEWKKELARGGVEEGGSQRWSGRRSWPEVEWKEELAGGGVGERTLYSRTVSCACTTCSYPVQGVPTPETAYVLLLTYPINEFRKLPYYSINAWFLGLSTLFVVVSQFNLVSV